MPFTFLFDSDFQDAIQKKDLLLKKEGRIQTEKLSSHISKRPLGGIPDYKRDISPDTIRYWTFLNYLNR